MKLLPRLPLRLLPHSKKHHLLLLLLWAFHPRAARQLLLRRPSKLHLLELLSYFSGRVVGLALRLLHIICIPLNQIPFLFRVRAWVLKFLLRAFKMVAPTAYVSLMERPVAPAMVVIAVETKEQQELSSSPDPASVRSSSSLPSRPPSSPFPSWMTGSLSPFQQQRKKEEGNDDNNDKEEGHSFTTPRSGSLPRPSSAFALGEEEKRKGAYSDDDAFLPDVSFQGCSWLLPCK